MPICSFVVVAYVFFACSVGRISLYGDRWICRGLSVAAEASHECSTATALRYPLEWQLNYRAEKPIRQYVKATDTLLLYR